MIGIICLGPGALRSAMIALSILSIGLTAATSAQAQGRSDQARFDISTVPAPAGAEIMADRLSSSEAEYTFPAGVADTMRATGTALNGAGWKPYRTPDQDSSGASQRFKNGRTGIYVSFTMAGGKSGQSRIAYRHNNSIPANIPFPDDATDIVYDENRPYFRAVSAQTPDALLKFFTDELTADGWSALTLDAIRVRWPDARLDNTEPARIYLVREGRRPEQPPISLTLQRTDNDRTLIDIRIAAFALPQHLDFYREFAGLPAPVKTKSVGGTGSPDSIRRESTALVIAEIPVVLAFYRREMTARGWREQENATVVSETTAKAVFVQPDGTAVLELGRRHDMTTVRLVAQLSEAAIAERARQKKTADAKFMTDALQLAQSVIADSERQRVANVAAAAAAPVEMLKALADAPAPIPVPDTAQALQFDGSSGQLDFTSPSSVKSIAAFYRDGMRSQGWKERKSVINSATMARLDFVKGQRSIGLTVMQFGSAAKVSASGSGLQVPADPTKELERLEAAEASGFPVPKNHSLSSPATWKMKGQETVFRREFNAQVPADIGSVLAFYRRELAQRGWTEQPDSAVLKSDNVRTSFKSPEGPAQLLLGKSGRETTINIVVKIPEEAARAGVLPTPGKTKVILENMSDADAALTIGKTLIRIPRKVSAGDPASVPSTELLPGKHRYVLKVAGQRDQTGELVAVAGDSWAFLIGPGGVLPMQMY